ncbi:hypothetical protein FQW77_08705 [Campylobacter jejuni]|nr:hypothetical protein [Campylobacter jejuni]
MKIKDYFDIYKKYEKTKKSLKSFSILNKKVVVHKYLKENKRNIIGQINYAFFESNEPYILSVFCDDEYYFIHINSRLTKTYPSYFNNENEYENYLIIFATTAVLFRKNFQIENINDSRLNQPYKEVIVDITNAIFYDETFRINLERYVNQEEKYLKNIYFYGFNFLINIFKEITENKISEEECKKILKINDDDFEKLFDILKFKLLEIERR